MGYHSLEELLPKSNESVYRLVRMAAARAMELADGKSKLIENPSSDKITTIALEEIMDGRVALKDSSEKLKEKTSK